MRYYRPQTISLTSPALFSEYFSVTLLLFGRFVVSLVLEEVVGVIMLEGACVPLSSVPCDTSAVSVDCLTVV